MSASIPVFDLSSHLSSSSSSSSSSPSPSTISLAESIVSAMSTHGFLFIKASPELGFSAADVSDAFSAARDFFASPRADKEAAAMQPNNRGWTAMGSETLDPATQKAGDPKEAFNFGEFGADGRARQPLPPAFRPYEARLARFSALCYGLCLGLLELVAIGLKIEKEEEGAGGIDAAWFSARHDPAKGESGTILRLLHYPASHAAAAVRAGAHSDYGSMTLLFRLPGQAGLEILTPEGAWARVPVQPAGTERDAFPPILVNIGDLLSYWTGGLLRSTVHRVTGGGDGGEGESEDQGEGGEGSREDRQSIAFFCHPCRQTRLVPVPSQTVRSEVARRQAAPDAAGDARIGYGSGTAEAAAEVARGRVLTADEHLHSRLAATYGWKNETITA